MNRTTSRRTLELVRDLSLALRDQVLPSLGSHAARAHEEDTRAGVTSRS